MNVFTSRFKPLCVSVALALTLTLLFSCEKEGADQSSASPAASPSSSGDVKIFKAPSPTSLKLAFVTNNSSEFWKIAAAGVHKYEREANVQVDIKMPPTGKTEEQNTTLENLLSQGYHGIAVSNTHWICAGRADDGRHNEFVILFARVSLLKCCDRIGFLILGLAMANGIEGFCNAVPAFVAIHAEETPAYGSDTTGAFFSEMITEATQ